LVFIAGNPFSSNLNYSLFYSSRCIYVVSIFI